jgi:hypothetical protein
MDHEMKEVVHDWVGSLAVVRSHSHETREEGERHHDYLIRHFLTLEENHHRSDIHAEAYDVFVAMVHWDDKDTVREEEEVHRRRHHWQIRSR